jgi:glycosyltransferase involved in cell wall biosynthesis
MKIVSALVCTRDRPDSLLRTVRSLLVSDGADFELLVIDQSDGPESEQALAALVSDQRLHYVRSRARGKGAALNEGLRLARGDILALTDDDCEAPPDWAVGMARTLDAQPTAAIVFCNVTAEPHDRTAGYVPAFERRRDRLVCTIGASCGELGLGAGMALRRAAVVALGGFDEAFGPGARFGSGDDWDISHRMLLSGWHVYQTAQLLVVHHGFRTFAEGSEHARRDWVAIGALCAKPLCAGRLGALAVPIWYFSVLALWPPLHDVMRLRQPSGLSRITGFIRGFVQGLRTPVDRDTLLFRRRAGWRTRARTPDDHVHGRL